MSDAMHSRTNPGWIPGLRPVQGPPQPVNLTPGLRPPGAPPGGPPPRLPAFPSGFYDPPVPEAVPSQEAPPIGHAVDYEAQTITGFLPNVNTDAPSSLLPEILLYTTKQKWRGLDVYLSAPGFGNAAGLTINVYGIYMSGARALVATGRAIDAAQLTVPLWIAAARANVERFEVTLTPTLGSSVGSISDDLIPFTVTIVASDQCVEPPKSVGVALRTTSGASAGTIILGPSLNADFSMVKSQVVDLTFVNTSTEARYVFLIDTLASSGVSPDAIQASFVWSLPAEEGVCLVVEDLGYRCARAMNLVASSTPGAPIAPYASVTDVIITATFR